MSSSQRLQDARAAAGFRSAMEAAERFGWIYNTYLSHENGTRGFKLETARKYGRAFNVKPGWLLLGDRSGAEDLLPVTQVKVSGEVAAGVWLEVDGDEKWSEARVPASPDIHFLPSVQVGFKVRGTSMNRVFKDGEFAIGALYGHTRAAQDGDIVVIKRHRAGLVETSLKRFRQQGSKIMLMPESDDPRFQEPLQMASSEDDTYVEIFALVIGRYESFV